MSYVFIVLVYGSFVLDFLVWPVPSEASTATLLKEPTPISRIKMTAVIIGHAIVLVIWLYPLLISGIALIRHETSSSGLLYLGIFLVVIGRGWTLVASRIVRSSPENELIVHSLFKLSRHPVVTGLHITLAGLLVLVEEPILWFLYPVCLIYFDHKIRIEESILLQKYGDKYGAYMSTTPRYLAQRLIGYG